MEEQKRKIRDLEELRKELIRVGHSKRLTDKDVLETSERLDDLILKFYTHVSKPESISLDKNRPPND